MVALAAAHITRSPPAAGDRGRTSHPSRTGWRRVRHRDASALQQIAAPDLNRDGRGPRFATRTTQDRADFADALVTRCLDTHGAQATDEIVNPLIGRGLLWDPFSCSAAAQPGVAGPRPGSGWSARSAARTYDLDRGEDRGSVRRRWAWSDPVAKSRVWGCQPCRAALPREGLGSRAPVVAATSTPDLLAPALRVAAVPGFLPVGRVGCQVAIVTRYAVSAWAARSRSA